MIAGPVDRYESPLAGVMARTVRIVRIPHDAPPGYYREALPYPGDEGGWSCQDYKAGRVVADQARWARDEEEARWWVNQYELA